MAPRSIRLQEQSICLPQAHYDGSILIIALWSVCLLVSFAVILGYGVRQKAALVSRLDVRSSLRLIAEAGVKRAIIELGKKSEYEEDADSGSADYDALDSSWSDNIIAFKGVRVGNGYYNVSYDFFNEKSGAMETRYGLTDEESKININKAGQPLLRRLFKITLGFNDTEAQELAAVIVDWRDGDSSLSIPLGSAEDFDYHGLQYPYDAKDADFEVLDELLLVKGMDEDIFEKLKEYITIYGDGKININTASSVILLSLGLEPVTVDKIIAFRYGEDNILGTDDDNVFMRHSDIVPMLSQFRPLSVSELTQLTGIASQHLVVKSENFKIRSTAESANRKYTAETVCVADRKGQILYWSEL